MLKRYLLFGFVAGSSNGGWNDFIDSYDHIHIAQAKMVDLVKEYCDPQSRGRGACYHIIDKQTGERIH